MNSRLYSRYRRKHDGFTVDVRTWGALFIAVIPSTDQKHIFTSATAAATAASKSAQSGKPVWQTKQQ